MGAPRQSLKQAVNAAVDRVALEGVAVTIKYGNVEVAVTPRQDEKHVNPADLIDP